jgi:amino acid adenylation domain-containing protein
MSAIARTCPTSFAQERLWLLEELDPDGGSYVVPLAYHIRGRLDRSALARAIAGVVARHEALRTVIRARDGVPEQVVLTDGDVRLDIVEAREPLGEQIDELLARPFDLATGPLLRTDLVRIAPDDHVFVLALHHVIADGWSLLVLTQELLAGYVAALEGGVPALEPIELQYGDVAIGERRREAQDSHAGGLRYWCDQLAGAQTLRLPMRRVAQGDRRMAHERWSVPREIIERLAALGVTRRMSPFMVLLGAYQAFLAPLSEQGDVTLATLVGNRRGAAEQRLIGLFVQPLILRTRVDLDAPFEALLARTRQTALDAYAHETVPFERIVGALRSERDFAGATLLRVALHHQERPHVPGGQLPAASAEPVPVGMPKMNLDLALWTWPQDGGLGCLYEYRADLFAAHTVRDLAQRFLAFLDAASRDPGRPLRTLLRPAGAGGPPQRSRALRDGTLGALLAARGERAPDAIALADAQVQVSYGQLAARAAAVARWLADHGAGPGHLVGVHVRDEVLATIAILGVLDAGAAYVPVDPGWPAARVGFVHADAVVAAWITDATAALRVPEPCPVLELQPGRPATGVTPPRTRAWCPQALACVIYTSGSTGRPKGVALDHGALAHFVTAAGEWYDLRPGDRFLRFASISFDAHAEELHATLAAGATVVVPARSARQDPHRLIGEIGALSPTILDLPTAYWEELARLDATRSGLPRCVRLTIIGGEAPARAALRDWSRADPPPPPLINTYGPTESCVVATAAALSGEDLASQRLSIGRPVGHARAVLVDGDGHAVGTREVGELLIGGPGVAQGYLGRPDLTADRFRPDAGGPPGSRCYHTGDLVRQRSDGTFEFVGRADHQVKLRGHRIELDEVEAVLRSHPRVRRAVAALDSGGPGEGASARRLVAHVDPAGEIDLDELRAHAAARLPAAMVPSAIGLVHALPTLPNGKPDRSALPPPAPNAGRRRRGRPVAPATALEEALAAIWSTVLELELGAVGREDDFFVLGGHSLLASRAVAAIRERLGADVALRTFVEHSTVASLAGQLETLGHHPVALRSDGSGG